MTLDECDASTQRGARCDGFPYSGECTLEEIAEGERKRAEGVRVDRREEEVEEVEK
jgi:hypothetical protein